MLYSSANGIISKFECFNRFVVFILLLIPCQLVSCIKSVEASCFGQLVVLACDVAHIVIGGSVKIFL